MKDIDQLTDEHQSRICDGPVKNICHGPNRDEPRNQDEEDTVVIEVELELHLLRRTWREFIAHAFPESLLKRCALPTGGSTLLLWTSFFHRRRRRPCSQRKGEHAGEMCDGRQKDPENGQIVRRARRRVDRP